VYDVADTGDHVWLCHEIHDECENLFGQIK
jgi:hypothetical protein